MKKEERQLFNFINKFKRHIQDHVYFRPMALSNFHHMSDRILDKKDGCLKLFKKNIKDMLKDTLPISDHGDVIFKKLYKFANSKNCEMQGFVDAVNEIYRDKK